ncbi:hypothetical protein [Albibacterium indicum]|nr:hypothetical protein [Pedobacter indicus]
MRYEITILALCLQDSQLEKKNKNKRYEYFKKDISIRNRNGYSRDGIFGM